MQVDFQPVEILSESRSRCIYRHHLDAADPRDARLVAPLLLKAAREVQAEVMLHARDELLRSFSTLCQARYAAVIADGKGILTWRCALPADMRSLDDQGLRIGSDWRESLEGTNGIGTCLETERPLSVHLGEHFKLRHAGMSSAAAPVRSPDGTISAVLGAVACNSQMANGSHLLARAAMIVAARAVEERLFRAFHAGCHILIMNEEARPSRRAYLAFDLNLHIVGADYYARRFLATDACELKAGDSLCALLAEAELCRASRGRADPALSLRRRADGVPWNCIVTAPEEFAWPSDAGSSRYFRLCASNHDPVLAQTPATPRGGLSTRARNRVQEYISRHFASEITLQDLAAIAEVSLSHFSREFKRCVGMSPHQYIVVKRVERAAQLISTTQHCLSEIALAVGFSDQSHFCRTFRHVLNMTPSEFRRALPGVRAPRRVLTDLRMHL